MQVKYSLFIIGFVFLSCQNQDKQKETASSMADSISSIVDTTGTDAMEATPEEKPALDQDTISLTLIDGKARQKGVMKKGRHVVFSLKNKIANATLSASVKPDEREGNVRIAQIFMPDGTADGPFGPTMEYRLTQPGNYKIVVSENQMAGDPYNGNFTLTVVVSQ